MTDIENIIYSRVIGGMPEKTKEKFPDLNFTTSDKLATNPKFPSVYIHSLGGSESGRDLKGIEINGVLTTIEVSVYDNAKQSNCKSVMDEIVKIMKSMRFEIVTMPEFRNQNTYRQVARFRRNIMALDKL